MKTETTIQKKFRVYVDYCMSGSYEIEATTKEEAVEKAHAMPNLPDNATYMEDSMTVEDENIISL